MMNLALREKSAKRGNLFPSLFFILERDRNKDVISNSTCVEKARFSESKVLNYLHDFMEKADV